MAQDRIQKHGLSHTAREPSGSMTRRNFLFLLTSQVRHCTLALVTETMLENIFIIGHDHFLSDPSQLPIHNSPVPQHLIKKLVQLIQCR